MKKMIFLMLVFFMGITASMNAQVAIGTGTGVDGAPAAGAVLELDGTKGALLLPKVNALSAIATPVKGMLVYLNLQDGDYAANKVYIYDGTWNVYAGPQGPAGAAGTNGAQGPKGDTGETGPQGPAGTNGAQGLKGDTGATGAAGKGISTTVINYATSTNGTTAPTSGWGTSIPSVADGSYLWTRTVINYTEGPASTAYAVGMKGATGATGATGPAGPGASINLTHGFVSATIESGTNNTTVTLPAGCGTDNTWQGQFNMETGSGAWRMLHDGAKWYVTVKGHTSGLPLTASSAIGPVQLDYWCLQ
jgi:hypothetical protein